MLKFKQVKSNPYAPEGSIWWEDEHGPSVHVLKPDQGRLTFTGAKAAYFRSMKWDKSYFMATDEVMERQPDNLRGFEVVEKSNRGREALNTVAIGKRNIHIGKVLRDKYDIDDEVELLIDKENKLLGFQKPKEGQGYKVHNGTVRGERTLRELGVEIEEKKRYKPDEREDKFIISL